MNWVMEKKEGLVIPCHLSNMVNVVLRLHGRTRLSVDLGLMVFIDDSIADCSSRMHSEIHRAMLSVHIKPDAEKLRRQPKASSTKTIQELHCPKALPILFT